MALRACFLTHGCICINGSNNHEKALKAVILRSITELLKRSDFQYKVIKELIQHGLKCVSLINQAVFEIRTSQGKISLILL